MIKIGKFLCKHFNTEDRREKSNIFSILSVTILRKVEIQTEVQRKRKIFFLHMEKVSKMICKVHDGDFLLDDIPWSGRSVDINSDQIRTLRTINVIPCGR